MSHPRPTFADPEIATVVVLNAEQVDVRPDAAATVYSDQQVRRIIARNLYDPQRGTRPNRWAALDEEGNILVPDTASPFFAGARVLLRRGLPADTLVTMRIEGKPYDSFIPVPLGGASRYTVSERTARSVRIEPWKPLLAKPGQAKVEGASPG